MSKQKPANYVMAPSTQQQKSAYKKLTYTQT
jgi:hypothetical protein